MKSSEEQPLFRCALTESADLRLRLVFHARKKSKQEPQQKTSGSFTSSSSAVKDRKSGNQRLQIALIARKKRKGQEAQQRLSYLFARSSSFGIRRAAGCPSLEKSEKTRSTTEDCLTSWPVPVSLGSAKFQQLDQLNLRKERERVPRTGLVETQPRLPSLEICTTKLSVSFTESANQLSRGVVLT